MPNLRLFYDFAMLKSLAVGSICLALVFPCSAFQSEPVQAATCQVKGGQNGRLKYSGQLNTVSATVCGDQIWKLIGKPTKPRKPTKPTKPVKYDHQFTVVPDRPNLSISQTEVSAGEPVTVTSLAVRHIRNRMLLWYPSQVRFKPMTYRWDFGDSNFGSNIAETHLWSKSGKYSVRVRVGYSVKYRIIGKSTWILLPGLVYAYSLPKLVTVGGKPTNGLGLVALVHWNCLQRPNAPGC